MESKNDFNCLSIGEQSESMQRGQWHPQSQGRPTYQATCRMNQHVQEEFRQSKQRTQSPLVRNPFITSQNVWEASLLFK